MERTPSIVRKEHYEGAGAEVHRPIASFDTLNYEKEYSCHQTSSDVRRYEMVEM